MMQSRPRTSVNGPEHALASSAAPTTIRPEGYFADAYPGPDERLALEAAMAEMPQVPERASDPD